MLIFVGIMLLVGAVAAAAVRTKDKSLPNLSAPLAIIGILLIVGGSLWGMVVQVPAGHRGVLLRFSAVQGVLSEGVHFIMPGVNTVELVETRTQKEESKATAASRDLQTVSTSLALNFRVDPDRVGDLYKQVGTQYKARIIDPAVQESLKVVTSRYTAEDLIRQRAQVKNEVENEIERRLKQYNILVDPNGLSITNFDFSPEFNRAIEAKQVAQQEAEKQKYVLAQAELERQTQVARARGASEAAKLNAEALKVQGGALVIAREWIEKWDGHLPSVSAGGGSGSGGFIIDLKSLMPASQPPR